MHVDTPRRARLRVPSRQLRGAFHDRPRERREPGRVTHDDVTARHARHVEPEVLGRRHPEGELVVLGVALADQDLVAVEADGLVGSPPARHSPSVAEARLRPAARREPGVTDRRRRPAPGSDPESGS